MTLKGTVLTLLASCTSLAAAQSQVVYDGRLATPAPRVSAQEQARIKGLAAQASRAGAWDKTTIEGQCSGQDFTINGVAPGAFTAKGAKQTAYLYTYCYVVPNAWSQGLVITEGTKELAHYTFTARTFEMYALKDINRNGFTELALSGAHTGQGYTSGYLEIAELAPQRRVLASFNSTNKLTVREDNCGAVSSGTWTGRVIRVTPGQVPRFTQQPISGRCGNDRTATGQGSVQAVKLTPEPTGWNAVTVTSPVTGGTNILGTTTPFSATALCQKAGCRVLGNAQVGPYLFATYATNDVYNAGSEGYFAFLKGGKTVAVGVYGVGSQDYTDVGTTDDLRNLVALTGRPLPSLKGVMSPPEMSGELGPQVLRRDRNVTLPLGNGLVLTNASQRVALGNDPRKLDRDAGPLRFIDVAYVALASEAGAIGRLINRWAPAEQKLARQAFLKGMGLVSACPARQSNGQTMGVGERTSAATTWALARGYTVNANTFYMAYALPGLALSSVELKSLGEGSMEALAAAPACVR